MDSMELIQFARVPPPDREPDAAEPLEGAVERDLDRLDTAVRDCRPAAWDLVVARAAAAFGRVLRGADAPRFEPKPDFADDLDDDFSGAFRPLAGCLVPPFEDLAIVSSLRGRLWSGMARSRQPRQVAFCFGLPATCNLGLGGHR